MKIKICGITTLEDALAAIAAGADMLGFNFYPPSPRYIEPAACAQLITDLRRAGAHATHVGVFVNMAPEQISTILDACGLDLAQLSGDEPAEQLVALHGRAFKAIRPHTLAEAHAAAARYTDRRNFERLHTPRLSPALLLDASAGPGQFGGTGQTADWALAQPLAAVYPLLLAGGLKPVNVAAAVAAVRPWGVDVASGVESTPGKKDAAKMRAFVQAARDTKEIYE